MRVGIIQPSFIPWRGYFDFIRSVDLFILLDDVQHTRRDWRSRNRIKTPQGARWLTVPVLDDGRDTLIHDVRIDHCQDWRRRHLGSWQANYGEAPCYSALLPLLDELYGPQDDSLCALNARMTARVCEYFSIRTPIEYASRLRVPGVRTDKLIGLLRATGATHYLSGPSADDYLDKALFAEAGITLEYKSYDYAPYPQRWGEFDGAVTVLDLIAHCGASSVNWLASRSPDRVIDPLTPRPNSFPSPLPIHAAQPAGAVS